MINTEHWSVDGVCDVLEGAAHQPGIAGELTETIRSALALAGQIDLALHGEPSLAASVVYAMPHGNGLVLLGETETASQAERAMELVRSLAGKLSISSQITPDPASTLDSPFQGSDAPSHRVRT